LDKLNLKYRGKAYKLLGVDFRDRNDGSLNIIFDRRHFGVKNIRWSPDGNEPVIITTLSDNEKVRISYHTSGRVNFHGSGSRSIYCEPLFNITCPQFLALYSIPDINRLDPVRAGDEALPAIEIEDEFVGRLTFEIALVPHTYDFLGQGPTSLIGYREWFGLAITRLRFPFDIRPGLEDHFHTCTSRAGMFEAQNISKHEALIKFHQKRAGTDGCVNYWEPNEGSHRVIFACPMRIPPRLVIEFENKSLIADVTHATVSEIRFRVRGPGGYLKTPPVISKLSLDARM
jgi:hypothetical protein